MLFRKCKAEHGDEVAPGSAWAKMILQLPAKPFTNDILIFRPGRLCQSRDNLATTRNLRPRGLVTVPAMEISPLMSNVHMPRMKQLVLHPKHEVETGAVAGRPG